MSVQRLVQNAVLLTCALLNVLAYPRAKDVGALQLINPSTLPTIIQPNSIPTNSTNAPPTPSPSRRPMRCFTRSQRDEKTDVDGCRPTLNYLRTFPNYRLMQDFRMEVRPRDPTKPPYIIHHELSDCAIHIAASNPAIEDRFSFEQARALATDILETCKDQDGRGGSAPIGRGLGWRVTVIGYKFSPNPPAPTTMPGEIGTGSTLPVLVVKA